MTTVLETIVPWWAFQVPAFIGFAGGLIGVVVGGLIARSNDRKARRREYVKEQLSQLYSPLLSLRRKIESLGQAAQKHRRAESKVWAKTCADLRKAQVSPSELSEGLEHLRDPLKESIDYDNAQLKEETLPMYRKMEAVLQNYMWLAEPETLSHWNNLVEFNEMWRRHMTTEIPYEIGILVGTNEDSLHPFYAHIAKTHEELRQRLAIDDF